MSVENDFPSRAHCLCRWYGLREFVVLSPAPGMEDVMTESRANMVLGSVSIALANTSWYVFEMAVYTGFTCRVALVKYSVRSHFKYRKFLTVTTQTILPHSTVC